MINSAAMKFISASERRQGRTIAEQYTVIDWGKEDALIQDDIGVAVVVVTGCHINN